MIRLVDNRETSGKCMSIELNLKDDYGDLLDIQNALINAIKVMAIDENNCCCGNNIFTLVDLLEDTLLTKEGFKAGEYDYILR